MPQDKPTETQAQNSLTPPPGARSLFWGGIVPVIAFTVIEEYFGIIWGLIAGMVFGIGEIIWEWRTQRKVSAMTWGGSGLILFLGGVSLLTQEGIWFKLQPALIEAVMALVLWVSVALNRPLITVMMEKQGAKILQVPKIREFLLKFFKGMTFRMGLFFALHAALASWAALYWSTAAWAILKGVGFTVSMLVYVVAESLLLRYRIAATR